MPQLKRRIRAIGQTEQYLEMMARMVQAEAKRLVPRKTGNLGRSIIVGHVTKSTATVEATANYATWVEKGTGIYGPKKRPIVPRRASVLAWPTGGSTKVRLSGRSRTRKGQKLADMAFATSVRGRKATPFMEPAAKKVAAQPGLVAEVVSRWNGAA